MPDNLFKESILEILIKISMNSLCIYKVKSISFYTHDEIVETTIIIYGNLTGQEKSHDCSCRFKFNLLLLQETGVTELKGMLSDKQFQDLNTEPRAISS